MNDLNEMDRPAFAQTLGWIFEGSPWVADGAAARRPFPSLRALYEALILVVERAGPDLQLKLLRAHPELAGTARMAQASQQEQSALRLEQLSAVEFDRLRGLLREYHERFGFPFIVAVRGLTPKAILKAVEDRYGRTGDTEFQQALQEVYRIAWFRLVDAVEDTTP